MQMADSNVIAFRGSFDKLTPDSPVSHDECLQLIGAFMQIRERSIRALLIRSAEAASAPDSAGPLSLENLPD
jgi:hypothetical protein